MGQEWKKLFNRDELDWFLKLGAAMTSPDEKKTFFEGVVERKRANPEWNFFEAYPREPKPREKFVGHEICAEILETLRGRKKREEGKAG